MNHLPWRFYAHEAVNHCENDARDGITIPNSCFLRICFFFPKITKYVIAVLFSFIFFHLAEQLCSSIY